MCLGVFAYSLDLFRDRHKTAFSLVRVLWGSEARGAMPASSDQAPLDVLTPDYHRFLSKVKVYYCMLLQVCGFFAYRDNFLHVENKSNGFSHTEAVSINVTFLETSF